MWRRQPRVADTRVGDSLGDVVVEVRRNVLMGQRCYGSWQWGGASTMSLVIPLGFGVSNLGDLRLQRLAGVGLVWRR
jgi:hypothetical protein